MARIVLVHGAFAGGWVWEPVRARLNDAGHSTETLDLPGSGADPTPVAEVTLEGYGTRVCEVLAVGEPAVLVGQSMGGMAVTQAAALRPDVITRLVYAAAFAPAAGQSLADLVTYPEAADDQVQANLVVEGEPPVAILPPAKARDALCNACTEEQASWAVSRLGAQPLAVFGMPVSVPEENRAAFEALPRAYILTTRDRAIPRRCSAGWRPSAAATR